MTEHTDTRSAASRAPLETSLETSWVTLQRSVAVGMIVVLAAPMVLVASRVIPPLLVPAGLFALGLGITWLRPRGGAIGIGVLSALWLVSQILNVSRVLPELTRPSATVPFLITLGMVTIPAAGAAGLAGALRRASGHVAVRTLQALSAILAVGVVVAVVAAL